MALSSVTLLLRFGTLYRGSQYTRKINRIIFENIVKYKSINRFSDVIAIESFRLWNAQVCKLVECQWLHFDIYLDTYCFCNVLFFVVPYRISSQKELNIFRFLAEWIPKNLRCRWKSLRHFVVSFFVNSTMRKDLPVSHFSIYDEFYDQKASIQDNPRESHQLFDPNIVSQLLAKALWKKAQASITCFWWSFESLSAKIHFTPAAFIRGPSVVMIALTTISPVTVSFSAL